MPAMVVEVTRTALLVAAALVLGGGSASASVVGPSGIVPLDISGTYTSLPNNPPWPDPFPTTSFDFTVLLPSTMDVNFTTNGGGTYIYKGKAAGTYADGGVNAAFSDALVVFVGDSAKFSIRNLFRKGDRLTVAAPLAGPEWTLSNPGGRGTLSLDAGSWTVSNGDVSYTPAVMATVPVDPPFNGQLTVPEPTSMAIFASGIVVLLGVTRRRTLRVTVGCGVRSI